MLCGPGHGWRLQFAVERLQCLCWRCSNVRLRRVDNGRLRRWRHPNPKDLCKQQPHTGAKHRMVMGFSAIPALPERRRTISFHMCKGRCFAVIGQKPYCQIPCADGKQLFQKHRRAENSGIKTSERFIFFDQMLFRPLIPKPKCQSIGVACCPSFAEISGFRIEVSVKKSIFDILFPLCKSNWQFIIHFF